MISPLCSKTPPQVPSKPIFAIEVTGCDAFMSEERVKACMDSLKDLPDLDSKASWDIPEDTPDATQDQAGVKESSSSAPE